MKETIKWVVWGVLLVVIFSTTLLVKAPEEIHAMLSNVADQLQSFSAVVHMIFLVVMAIGLIFKRIRNVLFSSFIALLSLAATIIAVKYMILPNIIIFAMFLVFIINAYLKKQLDFVLKNLAPANLFFGILGLVFGFWYLHWVESPVWFNALLYSPLGALNCPTMLTVCAFLCLTKKPRSVILEATVAGITLYFGFFGVFRLGAYVDVSLIVCSLFLILRLGSYLTFEDTFETSRA